MISRRALIGGGAAVLAGCYAPEQIGKAPAYAATPEADLHERFEREVRRASMPAPGAGIAVGVIAPGFTRAYGYGRLAYHDPRAPSADSVFDIGTLSKLFTGLLLAVLVAKGRVKLETKVDEILAASGSTGAGAGVGTGAGTGATLGELATSDAAHDAENNAAFATLGRALAAHEGRALGFLLEEAVFGPLGMASTKTFERSGLLESRLVEGADEKGQRLRAAFQPDPSAGAWGLRSTTNDLMRYSQALLTPDATPLAAALRESTTPRKPSAYGGEIAFGWRVDKTRGLLWKNGGLSGYRSALLVLPSGGRALSVLAADARIDALSLAHALLAQVPANVGR